MAMVLRIARELRVSPGVVVEACRLAVEDRKARERVERARLEAEASKE
jgi:hypothetical protein